MKSTVAKIIKYLLVAPAFWLSACALAVGFGFFGLMLGMLNIELWHIMSPQTSYSGIEIHRETKIIQNCGWLFAVCGLGFNVWVWWRTVTQELSKDLRPVSL